MYIDVYNPRHRFAKQNISGNISGGGLTEDLLTGQLDQARAKSMGRDLLRDLGGYASNQSNRLMNEALQYAEVQGLNLANILFSGLDLNSRQNTANNFQNVFKNQTKDALTQARIKKQKETLRLQKDANQALSQLLNKSVSGRKRKGQGFNVPGSGLNVPGSGLNVPGSGFYLPGTQRGYGLSVM